MGNLLEIVNQQNLSCLVYTSRATRPFDEAELRALLQKSRFNNSRDGISGMLTYVKGMFFQMLEGPEDKVEATYKRIMRDPRHGELRLVKTSRIKSRHFPQWTMGFPTPNAKMLSRFTGYCDLSNGSSSDLARLKSHDSGIFKIMCEFGKSLKS
ncbi:BLUF domain-containing protein [Pelagicoccus sp. NFK12]|uniref:BLUF domain-containing protein n=1 Tax=Pelagicoccus enzymogenes TaxID=2773457 RepID=A0A927IJM1_9BACT|nr:BLUF domain-containing protein [Pelagicoccus enzymogenes]MBD5781948.1 BLUF domain-containing protein [Pelagicoccus enzymogenes]